MRHLTAQAATHAVIVDIGDRIAAQPVLVGLDGERRTARQSNAGMVAGAHLRVDPETRANDALAGRQLACHLRSQAPLPGQLAFPIGDDHLEALAAAPQRRAQRPGDVGYAIGPHTLDPADTEALQGARNVGALSTTAWLLGAGHDLLLAGGTRIAVV